MRLALWMYLCFTLMSFNLTGQNLQQNNENTLRIKGVAILKQLPEVLSVAINIKLESSEYNDCHDRLMTAAQKAKEILISKGIDKNLIKTNEFRVTESKQYRSGIDSKVVFIGSASFSIETIYSVEFTKKLLSALTTDSLSFSYNITFKLTEDQKNRLRKEAISMAIKDAKDKAVLIAESSNVNLGKIKSIVYRDDSFASWTADNDIIREYQWNPENVIITGYASVNNPGSNTPTLDFNPKEIRLLKSVEIEWQINNKQ